MGWISCAACKEEFALRDPVEAALRRSGTGFHCPWGHSNYFPAGETEAEKLRRERDRLKQNEARLEDQLRLARNREILADRRAAAARGQVTKLKNRAAAGVCPCCNRQFVKLQAHMATKHPGFLAEAIEGTMQ